MANSHLWWRRRALPECALQVGVNFTGAAAVPPPVGARAATGQAAPCRGGRLEGEGVIRMERMVYARREIGAEWVDVEGATLAVYSAAGVEKAGNVVAAEGAGPVGVGVHVAGKGVVGVEGAGEGGGAGGAPLVEIEGADGAAVPPAVALAVAAITLEVLVDVD